MYRLYAAPDILQQNDARNLHELLLNPNNGKLEQISALDIQLLYGICIAVVICTSFISSQFGGKLDDNCNAFSCVFSAHPNMHEIISTKYADFSCKICWTGTTTGVGCGVE